jgi:hypothetical protein
MQTAPISGLQSPQQTQTANGDYWLHQIINAAKADPNGPFGKWVANAEKEAKWLFSQNPSDKQSCGSHFAAAQVPQAYSSDQISPEVQQNPNNYLSEPAIQSSARVAPNSTGGSDGASGDDHGKVINLDERPAQASRQMASPMMEVDDGSGSADDGGGSAGDGGYVGDGGSTDGGGSMDAGGSTDGGGQVNDGGSTDDSGDGSNVGSTDGSGGDGTTTQGSSDGGSDNQPVGTSGGSGTDPNEGTTSSTLNEAPVPLPVITEGTGLTSAAELTNIADLKAEADAAEQYAMQHPQDAVAAQKAQDLLEEYQIAVTTARQNSEIMAQQAMDALKGAKLN